MQLLKTHIQLCKLASGAASLKNQILFALSEQDGMTQTQLCSACGIKKTNVAALCKSMQKDGLIERKKQNKFMLVYITSKGMSVLKEASAKIDQKKYIQIIKELL